MKRSCDFRSLTDICYPEAFAVQNPMEPSCIRHTELPGASRLFLDFSYHFDKVSSLYPHNPHDPLALAQVARQIRYPDDRRAALVKALEAQNGPSEALAQLAKPGTVAVITGAAGGAV